MSSSASDLTSGRLLAKNTLWSLIGQLLPIAVAVVTIPLLVRGLGLDRFGVLSLVWVIIGYFSLFDLGIGRALTKLVADKLGARQEEQIPPLAWTSLFLMLLLGILGTVFTAAIAPWLVHSRLKIPAAMQAETLRAFYLLALSIPTVTVTSGLRGILEAQQQFRILNLIRIPMSIFSFAGPLLVLPFTHSLVAVVAMLTAGRIVGVLAHLLACFYYMPQLRQGFSLDRSLAIPVLKFGGWMTVSNIIGPIMVYMDRFLVGALVSVGAVAYYTAPFEMVTRIWIIPGSLVTVLFPAFAVSLVQQPTRTTLLLRRGIKYIFLAVFPAVLTVVALAPEGLRIWLGASFAENGSSVLRWLALGIFVNSLAHVPFAFLQSAGRPDLTAKLHLFELPFYLLSLLLLTKSMGIEGTAIAWTARVSVDAIVLFVLARKLLAVDTFFHRLAIAVAIACGCFCFAAFGNLVWRVVFLFCVLAAFVPFGWRILGTDERTLLIGLRSARMGTDSISSTTGSDSH